jgi:hypothetical protein
MFSHLIMTEKVEELAYFIYLKGGKIDTEVVDEYITIK